jgi:hypothetical protein
MRCIEIKIVNERCCDGKGNANKSTRLERRNLVRKSVEEENPALILTVCFASYSPQA